MRTWTVGDEDAGARLDVVLVRRVPGMSRAKARDAIADGAVRVNGRRAKKGERVAAGDAVELGVEPRPADFAAAPDAELPLRVVHEDAQLVVVDKQAGVPSHPLRPDERGTLAGALVARWPEMAGVGHRAREPGLVHRLDTGTSGLVLAARDRATFDALTAALREGRVEKRYLALVQGDPGAPRDITSALATDPRDARRVVATDDPRARVATTRIVSRAAHGAFSLLTVEAPRAGRHQVRAHLASIGLPLAGDALYGGPDVAGLARHFLHASSIALVHPATGARLALESPLPEELVAALRTASADRPAR